jgi:hypothetical protein
MFEEGVQYGSAAAGAGGGFFLMRWIFDKVVARLDRRQTLLDTQEAKVDREWQTIREELRSRLSVLEEEGRKRAEENIALRLAFEIVAGELRARDPGNHALHRAEQILAAGFPLIPKVPSDMAATLETIDRIDLAATAAGRATPAE